jgi:glycosyltransferase
MVISVITVCYNCVSTLEDTLLSVRKQGFKDIEYIVIDGGSTDGTVELLKRYDSTIHYWESSPDKGIYDAMNKGLKQASGDYVGFLHADDVFASDHVVSWLVESIVDKKPDVLYGDLIYTQANDLNKSVRRWKSCNFKPGLLKRGWMPPHPTVYIKRDVLAAIGFFDLTYKIAADYDYMLRLFSYPNLATVYVPQVLIKMRMGGASNKSVKNLIRKSREDYRALRRNKVGGWFTLLGKNLSKLPQFL